MNELDPSIIDSGIRDFVFFLRENGFNTSFSCEGGPGHACKLPTVWFRVGESENPEPLRCRLEQFMFQSGFVSFDTSCHYSNHVYATGGVRFTVKWVFLELYDEHVTKNALGENKVILPKPTTSAVVKENGNGSYEADIPTTKGKQ